MLTPFQPTLRIVHLMIDHAAMRVDLEAAPDGILAKILSLLGLGGSSRLMIDAGGVKMWERRLTGESRTYCPMTNVAASVFHRINAIWMLFAAALLALSSLTPLLNNDSNVRTVGVILLSLAAVFCVAFLFKRQSVLIGVVTNAATAESLRVKARGTDLKNLEMAAGIIEQLLGNQAPGAVDEDDAEAMDLNDSDEAPAERSPDPLPDLPPPLRQNPPAGENAGVFTMRCTNCQSTLRLKDEWRGKVISCPACRHKQPVAK